MSMIKFILPIINFANMLIVFESIIWNIFNNYSFFIQLSIIYVAYNWLKRPFRKGFLGPPVLFSTDISPSRFQLAPSSLPCLLVTALCYIWNKLVQNLIFQDIIFRVWPLNDCLHHRSCRHWLWKCLFNWFMLTTVGHNEVLRFAAVLSGTEWLLT